MTVSPTTSIDDNCGRRITAAVVAASANWKPWSAHLSAVRSAVRSTCAVGEAVILLHPCLPLAGGSIGMEREQISKMTVSPIARSAAAGSSEPSGRSWKHAISLA